MRNNTPQTDRDERRGQADEPRHLIDVPTLAAQLCVTPRFVRRLIAEDRVPFLKIGKFIRFDPAEIERWVDEQRVSAA